MKPFSSQLRQCKSNGLTSETKFMSFEAFPDLKPAGAYKRSLIPMMKAIESGEMKGIDVIVCGKFGGVCNSGHPQCKQLRQNA